MLISELAKEYIEARHTCLLTKDEVAQYIIEAAKEYKAWGRLKAMESAPILPESSFEERNGNIYFFNFGVETFILSLTEPLSHTSKIYIGPCEYTLNNFDDSLLEPDEIKSGDLVRFTKSKMGYQCITFSASLNDSTFLTNSEWGVIKVLAHLFIEREACLIQEASRYASYETYGRTSSEIEQEIVSFRNEYFRQWAFNYECESI